MSTASMSSGPGVSPLRAADLILLLVALPVFLLVPGIPFTGWLAGAGAYLLQLGLGVMLERRAVAATETRTVLALTAGGMIARGWLVAAIIFGSGLADRATGLSAALLFLAVFTIALPTRALQKGTPTP